MPIFKIEIHETLTAVVAVRAADKDEAMQMVEDDYSAEKIVLDSAHIGGDIEFNHIDQSEADPEPDFTINC